MNAPDDRTAELIAAALAGDLTDGERAELDRLRRDRPWIDEELRDLGVIAARLRQGDVTWTAPRDVDSVRERVDRAIGDDAVAATERRDALPSMPPRRRWMLPLLAAACLAVGFGVGLAIPDIASPPASGPPGTLGAVEQVAVADDLVDVDIDAQLVAHTWGTEAILEATGLDVGETYAAVFIGADGTEFSGGEILGSEVPIVCRLNAAVMRTDAVRFEIRDAATTVIAHADLPRA